jgi:SAM-dependent methyltransferase
MTPSSSTREPSYTARLERLQGVWWKRLLDVQRPYRWNLRRLELGFVLDVGCGLGRNLINLGGRAAGVGVDHNAESVAACERSGLVAFTPEAFRASDHARPGRFDTLLLAHVVEHMRFDEARALIEEHLPFVRPGGRVVLMAPEEAGFASDATHVEFMDLATLDRLARAVGLVPERGFSFPFPRPAGRLFKYNEFVLIARKP